jgi:hypothetical protein
MFTVDTLIDNATKTTKSVLVHIPNDDIRTGFESIVDANATFAKTIYNTSFELAKNIADSAIAAFPKQPVAKK